MINRMKKNLTSAGMKIPHRGQIFTAPARSVTGSTRGFTLIELMTVIAIIGVLSTLLISVVVKVKQRADEVKCTSNLKQIATSTFIYLEEQGDPPASLVHMYNTDYITQSRILDCPSDRTGNWGELVSAGNPGTALASLPPISLLPSDDTALLKVAGPRREYPDFSYLQAFHMRRRSWDALMLHGRRNAGVVACQLHGIREPSAREPSIYAYSGRVLRANINGEVVRKQLFWNEDDRSRLSPGMAFLEANLSAAEIDRTLWRFFSDSPVPAHSMMPRRTGTNPWLFTQNSMADDKRRITTF